MTEEATIRILITDDVSETRENVRKLLEMEPDMAVVGTAASSEEGIRAARELRPDIVLLDVNLPDRDGIETTKVLAGSVPQAKIIIISIEGEPEYLRRAMMAGARDYLVKPFSSAELTKSIRRVHSEPARAASAAEPAREPQRQGQLIAAYSPKGGSGTSTVAVNLAIALAGGSHRVALVDGSLQAGDLEVLLNLAPHTSIADLAAHVESLHEMPLEEILIGHGSGVSALLAPPRPELADLLQPDSMAAILGHLAGQFDYVVVDTWTTLNDLTLAIFDVSHLILLVGTPEITSIRGIRRFLELADALGYPPDKVALMVNKLDRRGGIALRDIEDSLKRRAVGSLSKDDELTTMAINTGVPFVTARPKAALSQEMLDLAGRLAGGMVELSEQRNGRQPGLFARLLR